MSPELELGSGTEVPTTSRTVPAHSNVFPRVHAGSGSGHQLLFLEKDFQILGMKIIYEMFFVYVSTWENANWTVSSFFPHLISFFKKIY